MCLDTRRRSDVLVSLRMSAVSYRTGFTQGELLRMELKLSTLGGDVSTDKTRVVTPPMQLCTRRKHSRVSTAASPAASPR